MANESELKRILQMVESGTITAEEGDALLSELMVKACPWCAEKIPGDARVCPECSTNLIAPIEGNAVPRRNTLGALNACLVFYTVVVSCIVLFSNATSLPSPDALCRMTVAGLGVAAGILIWKRHSSGWVLGIIWSVLQIVTVYIDSASLNKMFFFVGGSFQTNGSGLGLNIVGVILLVLFIRGMKQQRGNESWQWES